MKNTVNSAIFARVLFSETSQTSQIGEITLPFTDIGKSSPCREFSTFQICVLKLFAKIKFLQNFQIYSNIPTAAAVLAVGILVQSPRPKILGYFTCCSVCLFTSRKPVWSTIEHGVFFKTFGADIGGVT